MKYRSRISVLLTLFLLAVFSMPLFDGVDYLAKIISLGIPFVFTVLVFATINYTILEGELIIRTFGFKAATIKIDKIKSIKRSYNPLSSPAASLKRLELKFYHKGRLGTALISPIREAEFIEKLKSANPSIKVSVMQKRNVLHFWDWDI